MLKIQHPPTKNRLLRRVLMVREGAKKRKIRTNAHLEIQGNLLEFKVVN